jgi:hypothetical protein
VENLFPDSGNYVGTVPKTLINYVNDGLELKIAVHETGHKLTALAILD